MDDFNCDFGEWNSDVNFVFALKEKNENILEHTHNESEILKEVNLEGKMIFHNIIVFSFDQNTGKGKASRSLSVQQNSTPHKARAKGLTGSLNCLLYVKRKNLTTAIRKNKWW